MPCVEATNRPLTYRWPCSVRRHTSSQWLGPRCNEPERYFGTIPSKAIQEAATADAANPAIAPRLEIIGLNFISLPCAALSACLARLGLPQWAGACRNQPLGSRETHTTNHASCPPCIGRRGFRPALGIHQARNLSAHCFQETYLLRSPVLGLVKLLMREAALVAGAMLVSAESLVVFHNDPRGM